MNCDNCNEVVPLLHWIAGGYHVCSACRREMRAEFRLYVERATASRKVSRAELREIMRDF